LRITKVICKYKDGLEKYVKYNILVIGGQLDELENTNEDEELYNVLQANLQVYRELLGKIREIEEAEQE
jgi:hypothetical protein